MGNRFSPNNSGTYQATAVLILKKAKEASHTFQPNFKLRKDFKYSSIEPLPFRVRKETKAPTAGPNAARIETGIVIPVNNSLLREIIPYPANTKGNQISQDHENVTIKYLNGNFSFSFRTYSFFA